MTMKKNSLELFLFLKRIIITVFIDRKKWTQLWKFLNHNGKIISESECLLYFK